MLMPENVFLAVQPVDMRRGIDTLAQYVQDELKPSRHLNSRLALMPFLSASFNIDTPGSQDAATSYCLNPRGAHCQSGKISDKDAFRAGNSDG